ncbi:23S rRNA (adenine(1618)-N(6))-methyltransferase RlmF [bacterium]|nr:MAG: 23S rRNA (adenine(1618)-N(6))-methyltransferase RlmF [bacterium]
MHPRNRHGGRYDLERLTRASPALAPFVARNAHEDLSVDFADPAAVKALNAALLKDWYGLEHWDLPPGALCPPVPGRSDYVHAAADLLSRHGAVPRGDAVRVLDVGVGASCIYPILGRGEYGWSFVGTDVDPAALRCAGAIVAANPLLAGGVELRRQKPPAVLKGVIASGERFALTLCNPPFHASQAEAEAGTRRKWTNLGRAPGTARNFGGRAAELWCPGGEAAFAQSLVEESAPFAAQVAWFTVLLSKAATVDALKPALRRAQAADVRVVEMAQGNKKSRLLAWTFRDSR